LGYPSDNKWPEYLNGYKEPDWKIAAYVPIELVDKWVNEHGGIITEENLKDLQCYEEIQCYTVLPKMSSRYFEVFFEDIEDFSTWVITQGVRIGEYAGDWFHAGSNENYIQKKAEWFITPHGTENQACEVCKNPAVYRALSTTEDRDLFFCKAHVPRLILRKKKMPDNYIIEIDPNKTAKNLLHLEKNGVVVATIDMTKTGFTEICIEEDFKKRGLLGLCLNIAKSRYLKDFLWQILPHSLQVSVCTRYNGVSMKNEILHLSVEESCRKSLAKYNKIVWDIDKTDTICTIMVCNDDCPTYWEQLSLF
jgi:hypothetical protein